MFDFVSLRYLYHKTERHQVKPTADEIASIRATETTTNSKAIDAGLSADTGNKSVTPSLTVHVQRDNTLTFERDMKSWRRGLDFEPYSRIEHDRKSAAWAGRYGVKNARQHHYFQVTSRLTCLRRECKFCKYEKYPRKACQFRLAPFEGKAWYDRCAHWFWQTEAASHAWLPETYESFVSPITVTRIFSVREIESEYIKQTPEVLLKYLHFDFVVNVRLRELGWRWSDYNPFYRSPKPTEMRAKKDFGYPLAIDRVAFCLWSCVYKINWPQFPTRDLQDVADDMVEKKGKNARRLPARKEYYDEKEEETRRRGETQERRRIEKEVEILENVRREVKEQRLEARLDRLEGDRGRSRRPQSPVRDEQKEERLRELLELVKKRENEIASLRKQIEEHMAMIHSLQAQVEVANDHRRSSYQENVDGTTAGRVNDGNDQGHSYISQLNIEIEKRKAEAKKCKEEAEGHEQTVNKLKRELERKEEECETKLEEFKSKERNLVEERDHWKKVAERLEGRKRSETSTSTRVNLSPSRVPRRFIHGEGIRRLEDPEMEDEERQLRVIDEAAELEGEGIEHAHPNRREAEPHYIINIDSYEHGNRVGSRGRGSEHHHHDRHRRY